MKLYKPTPPEMGISAFSDNKNHNENTPITEHYHDFFEFYYLKSGFRRYFFRDHFFEIGPGTLSAVPPFTLHKTSIPLQGKHDYMKIQVLASPCFIKKLDREDILDPLSVFNSQSYPIYLLKGSFKDDFEKKTEELVSLSRQEGSRQILFLKYQILLLDLSQALIDKKITPLELLGEYKKNRSPIQLVAKYLKDNYKENQSLNDLAHMVELHPKYLCRLFKEEMGLTISQYRNLQRVNEAQFLLLHGNFSLEKVAEETGFAGLTQLGRVFKKFIGESPSQWRKKRRDKGFAVQ